MRSPIQGALPALIFGGMIAAVALAHFVFRLNAILSFWIAYVLTRPLGASIGDWMSQHPKHSGLGLGTTGTSAIFLSAILTLVVYLSISKTDQTPTEVIEQEERNAQEHWAAHHHSATRNSDERAMGDAPPEEA
jgi:uncharacterized membrane-anchored protein